MCSTAKVGLNGDQWFLGGIGSAANSAITGTTEQALYRSYRLGRHKYELLAPVAGNYLVNLKFAETFHPAANRRKFHVTLNGTRVETDLDVFAQAGASLKALDRQYPLRVSNGRITLLLDKGSLDVPLLNANRNQARAFYLRTGHGEYGGGAWLHGVDAVRGRFNDRSH